MLLVLLHHSKWSLYFNYALLVLGVDAQSTLRGGPSLQSKVNFGKILKMIFAL